MIIKTEKVKLVLYDRALTGYSLEASGIGISRQSISQIRKKGKDNFENLPVGTIIKVQKWIDDGNFKICASDEDAIEETKN